MSSYDVFKRFPAKVVNNDDPEKRGRLMLTTRQLTSEGTSLPVWVNPSFPYAGVGHGFFFVPDVGDMVLLEMLVGSSDDAVVGESAVRNPNFRWLCGLYSTQADIPDEFKRGYPKRWGFKSSGGIVIIFDDPTKHLHLVAPKIHLGSETSDEPLVLGNVFVAMMSVLLDLIATHTHLWALGPTSPPTNAMAFTALKVSPIVDQTIVSAVAYTEKRNP